MTFVDCHSSLQYPSMPWLQVGDKVAAGAAWSYPTPSPTFARIKDCIAFYPAMMDACFVDDERVHSSNIIFVHGLLVASHCAKPTQCDKASQYDKAANIYQQPHVVINEILH